MELELSENCTVDVREDDVVIQPNDGQPYLLISWKRLEEVVKARFEKDDPENITFAASWGWVSKEDRRVIPVIRIETLNHEPDWETFDGGNETAHPAWKKLVYARIFTFITWAEILRQVATPQKNGCLDELFIETEYLPADGNYEAETTFSFILSKKVAIEKKLLKE